MKPNAFDNRFIVGDNDMNENGKNQIVSIQPSIAHDSYLASYCTSLDMCLQGIISPSTLGIDVKKLDNADAQREKEKTTLYTRDAIIEALQETLPELISATINAYHLLHNETQVYANTGAGTYEKAVDMATKDFLKAGLNCLQYANGARHTIADYADMAIRTASKRAYLQGEGVKRQEWGIHTVIINKRGSGCPCPLCVPFVGKVMIDDVWSGGTKKEAQETGYRLMSDAITAGLYHPRCRDSHTTYFPGISTPPDGRYVVLDYSEHEKNVAEIIAKMYGKEVQMIPRVVYPQGVSTPDFKIEGKGWDLKTISTGGKNVLYNAIKKKKRQAGNFIFDITDCPLKEGEIMEQVNNLFRSTHLSFLEEVALYKDRKIVGVYQRNKK